MKTYRHKLAIPLLLSIAFAIILPGLLSGCQGTKAQRTLYVSTDSLGTAVDKAIAAFTDYEVAQARATLGAAATAQSIRDHVASDPAWKQYVPLREKYNSAFALWCEANAIASSGTNAAGVLTDPSFRSAALQAAADLTAFIAKFVPAVQPVTP